MTKIIAQTNAGGMVPGHEYTVTEPIARILLQSGRAKLAAEAALEAEVILGTEEVSALDEASLAESPEPIEVMVEPTVKQDFSIDALAEELIELQPAVKTKSTKK